MNDDDEELLKAPPEEPRHRDSASLNALRQMRAECDDRISGLRSRARWLREEADSLDRDIAEMLVEKAELARDIEALELMHDRWAAEAGAGAGAEAGAEAE